MEAPAPDKSPEEPVMKTVEVIVSGQVQRVGFRACVRKLAVSLTVGGEVMNLPDGRVRIVASGEDIILEKFISSLYGCPRAVVRDVVVTPREYVEYATFSVERGGI
ncbi:acylphosphatase [Methanovulcanius yangii]|uniref:acylphosphatase n=1 Tax=Methanovulcanius yangii TaxID=1789227 RepID=UPI0029C9D141|nr:acylphosphatase [Methanovulcanius yangii]